MRNKIVSILIFIVIYIVMTVLGVISFFLLPITNKLLNLLVVDLICTIFICLVVLIFKNSSIYDSYWSSTPILLIVLYSLDVKEINTQTILFYIVIGLWSIRLTYNFFRTMKDIKTEDWRYTHFRNKKFFFLSNLFGIHLVPTLIVYACLLPAFYYIDASTYFNWNLSSILGYVVMITGFLFETIGDKQLKEFKKNNKNPFAVCNVGLWSKSRHPNYFGEILIWWGVYLMMLSLNEKMFILILGPILVTLLFAVVSIPLMEQRQLKTKRDYKEYMEQTSMLIPMKKTK